MAEATTNINPFDDREFTELVDCLYRVQINPDTGACVFVILNRHEEREAPEMRRIKHVDELPEWMIARANILDTVGTETEEWTAMAGFKMDENTYWLEVTLDEHNSILELGEQLEPKRV